MKKNIVTMFLVFSLIFAAFLLPVRAYADTPSSEYDIVSISAGYNKSGVVLSNGSVWLWGCRGGNDTTSDFGLAVGYTGDNTNIMICGQSASSINCSDIQTGYYSSGVSPSCTALLKDDGSLWTWGGNEYGSLGTGDTTYNFRPQKILENVIDYQIGAHSAAVTTDGSLYMWGNNCYGQLGDGTTVNSSVPVKVDLDNVKAVALGNFHTAAVTTDGSLYMWGYNSQGQLGNGTTENSSVPIKIMDNVASVALGAYFSAAVQTDGTLWTWGDNGYGQLGINSSSSSKNTPQFVDDIEDVAFIEAGGSTAAAIKSDGSLWMWGRNGGIYGNNTTAKSTSPEKIRDGVKDISLGTEHSLVLLNDGSLWASGYNSHGQLGDHTRTDRTAFVQIFIGRRNVSFADDGVPTKTLDIAFDETSLMTDSTGYDPDLAIAGLILSQAAYNKAQDPYVMRYSDVLSQLGYRELKYVGTSSESAPGYYAAYKATYDFDDPQIYVVIAFRGSTDNVDWVTNIKSIVDNFDVTGNYCVDVWKSVKNSIVDNISSRIPVSKKNTHYFITGHSLGGACAGKLGLMLVNKGLASPQQLTIYTYAAPTYNTDWLQTGSVPRLFNIVRAGDIVPKIPGFMYNGLINIPAFRAGQDRCYSPTDSDTGFMNSLSQLYGEYPADRYVFPSNHKMSMYLATLLSKESQSTINTLFSKARIVRAHCPVEIEVYDPEGELCAYTSNGEVTYPTYSAVRIVIIEDEKFIELPDDGEYTIKYIGTDTGTMNVEDQIYDVETGEIQSEKCFENVVLEEGKTFESVIDTEEEEVDTELYVVNESGSATAEVLEDGTEVPLGPAYIPGDINGDEVVNNKDVTRLMRYIKYGDVDVEEAALDVNGDGVVNNKDVTRLMRYIKYGDVDIY